MSTQETVSATPPVAGPRHWPRRRPSLSESLAAGGLAAVLATAFLNFGAHLGVGALDADSTSSWSHNVVRAILAAAVAVSLVGAWRARGRAAVWLVAAMILAFLAVDEISTLHTQVDAMSWGKLIYVPLLAILGLCLWRLAGATDQSRVVGAALALLGVSFATHVLGPHIVNALGMTSDSWGYQMKGALKQSTELAGWVLMFSALLRLSRGPSATVLQRR